MVNAKKNHHFVPKLYLKNFTDGAGYIHIWDKNTKQIRCTNKLKEIAKRENLYTITNKISLIDIEYAKKLSKLNFNDSDEEALLWYVRYLNDDLGDMFSVVPGENSSKESIELINKVDKHLKSFINSKDISRNQEDLFEQYEKDFYNACCYIKEHGVKDIVLSPNNDFLNYIYFKIFKIAHFRLMDSMTNMIKMHASTLKDKSYTEEIQSLDKERANIKLSLRKSENSIPNYYFDIVHYMFLQHFRVPYFYKKLIAPDAAKFLKTISGLDMHNVACLITHIMYLKYIAGMLDEGYKLIFIKNTSTVPFITSDNPSIFIYEKLLTRLYNRKLFEMFFPITPTLGLLYSSRECYTHIPEIVCSSDSDALQWNLLLKEHSTRYLYANNSDILIKLSEH